jgi:hypothetical protein
MNNVPYDRLTQVTDEWLHKTPSYVHTVGYGHKYTNGINTNQGSIVFNVAKKLPKDQIPEDELIPSEINIDGNIYKTDIIESEYPRFAASCYNFSGSLNNGISNIPSIDALRKTVRPLKGGISIGNLAATFATFNYLPAKTYAENLISASGGYEYSFGTLGAIVVDNEDNSLVGLTNAHVVIGRDAGEGWATYARKDTDSWIGTKATGRPDTNTLSRAYNILDDTYYQLNGSIYRINQKIIQPGEDLIGNNPFNVYRNDASNNYPSGSIGTVKRYAPVTYTGTNNAEYSTSGLKIDAAIISLRQDQLNEAQSWKFAGLESIFTKPIPFATTAQINLITVGSNVWSVGRSTGPKGSGICTPLVISSTNTSVDATKYSFTTLAAYTDLFGFKYQDNSPYAFYHGDSGSVSIMNFGTSINPDYRIVGLNFLLSDTVGTIGFFARIDNVASQLNISAFTGSGYNDSSITTINRFVSGTGSKISSGALCGTSSGTFWQAGQIHTNASETGYYGGGIVFQNYIIVDSTGNNCKPF